jgi:hypothetical protein
MQRSIEQHELSARSGWTLAAAPNGRADDVGASGTTSTAGVFDGWRGHSIGGSTEAADSGARYRRHERQSCLRHALACGYSVERVVHDYGIDVSLSTYNEVGEIENGQILFQLKATDHLRVSRRDSRIPLPIQRSDLELWLGESMPVILILYDARQDKAYWLYVQAYCKSVPGFDLNAIGKTYTVYFAPENVFDSDTPRRFAEFRDDVMMQIREVVSHEL